MEDEENLHYAIKLNLEMDGFSVISAFNGKNAVSKYKKGRFDLIILDVMLPEMNGFDICEVIRLDNSKIPILFLTAKSTNEDKVKGLKMADDYLTKPFNLKELLLRVKNLLKRTNVVELNGDSAKTLIAGCLVDFNSFEVTDKDNNKISLTHKQIKLLKLFVDKQDEVISRQEILEKIWGYDVYPSSRTIDNFILMFRKIFEKNLPSTTHFKSVRGVGYKFTP